MSKYDSSIREKSGLLAGLLVLTLLGGCSDLSHTYVDEVKSKAEESQSAMRAMNSFEQAKQSYLSGDLETAHRYIKESVACKGDVADALVLQLQIEIDMNRNAEVLETAAAGKKVAPNDSRFPYYTGIYYERSGHSAEALTCYKEAARMDPSSVQYKLAAAEIMIEEKQFVLAEAYLKQAIRTHSNAPGLLQTLGALAQIRGDNRKAAVYFSEALALAPTAQPLRENMAKVCFSLGDYFKAMQYLEPLLKEPGMEDRRDLQSIAAQCYLKCNQPIEARSLLRKLIKEPGGATYAQLRQIADGALMLSDWPLLKTAGKQMISLDPGAEPGYLALAVFYEKTGDKATAWQALEDYKRQAAGLASPLLLKYQEELK